MYYIINENQQIIAADPDFLKQCHVSDITALNREIILENTIFDTQKEKRLSLQIKQKNHHFTIKRIPLSTLIGALTLIVVESEEPTSSASEETISQKEVSTPDTYTEDIEQLILHKEPETPIQLITDIEKEVFTDTEVDIVSKPAFSPTDKESIYIDVAQISQEIGVNPEDYHAFLDEYISTALSLEKDLQSEHHATRKDAVETLLHLGTVLHLDPVQDIIMMIDNATEEQRTREVSSFYDALSRITTEKKHTEEESILSTSPTETKNVEIDLGLVIPETDSLTAFVPQTPKEETFDLHLDDLPPLVETEKKSTEQTSLKETKEEDIFSLDLDTPPAIIKEEKETQEPKEEKFELDFKTDTPEVTEKKTTKAKIESKKPTETKKPTKTIKTEKVPPNTSKPSSFGEIDLSDVKPIHFDFSLHEAAEELSLPESLIEEFMIDFIAQAHTETDKMLVAYKQGDLDAVQKIGHLLKGVSSNLRITPLADTLYNIQFCKDSNDLDALIKTYWGHFLSFETQMHRFSK